MNLGAVRPFVARQNRGDCCAANRAATTLPGSLRHPRPVAATRRSRSGGLRSGSSLHQRTHVHAIVAQLGARFFAARSPQEFGRRLERRRQASARGRRRRHGRRHCRVVGISGNDGHLAGSQRSIDRAGAEPRQGFFRKAAEGPGRGVRSIVASEDGYQGRRRFRRRCRHRSDI